MREVVRLERVSTGLVAGLRAGLVVIIVLGKNEEGRVAMLALSVFELLPCVVFCFCGPSAPVAH